MSVLGNFKGAIDASRDILLAGKVVGDVRCNNIERVGAALQGNITTKGRVQMDSDSLVLGDLSAQYVGINGKLRGNLEIAGKTELGSDAVVLGNIRTAAITITDGANVQGYIDTAFLSANAESVFPGKVIIGEE